MASIEKSQDALVIIHQRNQFYRNKFHLMIGVYVLSLIVIAILIGVVIYLLKNPTMPLYFVTDEVSRLIQDVPRELPNMSDDNVALWATEAIEHAYSYDFVNYRSQLQNAQKYFTDYGWRNYMDGLKASNNLIALTQRKYVIVAKAVGKPRLLIEGILGGAYAWKFEIPLLATYYSSPYDEKNSFRNPLLVTVIVQRQSILNSYRGLGIVQTYGSLVLSPVAGALSNAPPQ